MIPPPNSAEIYVANVTGGTNNIYEYSINGGTWQTTKSFSNLRPGSYIVRVRNKVAAGQPFCEWSKTLQVEAPIAKPVLSSTIEYDCEGIARMKVTSSRTDYSTLLYTLLPMEQHQEHYLQPLLGNIQ